MYPPYDITRVNSCHVWFEVMDEDTWVVPCGVYTSDSTELSFEGSDMAAGDCGHCSLGGEK